MQYSQLDKTKYYVDRSKNNRITERQRAWARIKGLELIAETFERSGVSSHKLEAISNRAEAKALRKKYGF